MKPLWERLGAHPTLKERIQLLTSYKIPQKSINENVNNSLLKSNETKIIKEELVNRPGKISIANVNYAQKILETIPEELVIIKFCQDSSRALILSYFVHDSTSKSKEKQIEFIKNDYSDNISSKVREFLPIIKLLDDSYRLPLIDLAILPIKRLNIEEKIRFISLAQNLIELDKKVSITEFILFILVKGLLKTDNQVIDDVLRGNEIITESEVLLSLMAYLGKKQEGDAINSYKKGSDYLWHKDKDILLPTDLSVTKIYKAVKVIRRSRTIYKKKFLQSCQKVIEFDGKVTIKEFEALRMFSEAMLVPMPPIAPSELNI